MRSNEIAGIRAVICIIIVLGLGGISSLADGELDPVKRTYTQAQSIEWLDADHFAVGRWDGTITLFSRPTGGNDSSPDIFQAVITPSGRGVEEILVTPGGDLAASNNNSSLALYRKADDLYQFSGTLPYYPDAGMFNADVRLQPGLIPGLSPDMQTGALFVGKSKMVR